MRVDAHHLAARVEQRPTRVAGVHRHVGLDERHGAVVRQGAAFGADHTGGDRVLKAERRADGQHPFTHAQIAGLADGHHRQVLGVNLQHRHVGLGVSAQHLGDVLAPVGQLDGNFLGVAHHVGVGQDDAVGVDDKARALAVGDLITRGLLLAARVALLALLSLLEAAKKFKERVVAKRVLLLAASGAGGVARLLAGHADVHHGRAVLAGDLCKVGCHDGTHHGRGDTRLPSHWRNGCGKRGGGRRRGCVGTIHVLKCRNAGATNDTGSDEGQHQAGAFENACCHENSLG